MEENKQKNSRRRLNSLILLVAFTAVMLIVSTYAWFSTQKNVTLANLEGTVKVAEGLQISLDAKNWSNSIDFSDYNEDQTELKQLYGDSAHNLIPTEMLPVSTTAKENLDDSGSGSGIKELAFYRGTNVNGVNLYDIKAVENDLAKIDNTSGSSEGTDKITAAGSPDKYPGYYAIDFFLENSSAESVGFDTLQLNSDSSVNVKSDGNSTVGLQNTPRVAFALFNSDTSSGGIVEVGKEGINQDTILAATTKEKSTIKDVAIWEPNANKHVEYIVTNNNKITFSSGDETDYSITLKKFTDSQRIPTYALNSTSSSASDPIQVGSESKTGFSDIYNWDGTTYRGKLEKQITLQTDSGAAKVQNLISVTSPETAVKPSDASGAKEFQIPKNQVCRVRMYIWLEGQDVDCINYASHGGGIEIDVGLIKDAIVGNS